MNKEPTLTDLENQQPQSQEELVKQIAEIDDELAGVRFILRMTRQEESLLMSRRTQLRSQLSVLKLKQPSTHLTVRAEVGAEPDPADPICPDCTPEDG